MSVSATYILWPVCAMAFLTFLVMLLIPFRRFRAGFAGKVTYKDFRYGESPNVPGDVSIPNRNYMNLLEAPTLFYVVCIAAYVAQLVTPALILMAWIYFGLRVLHTVIHLTYNNVKHRLALFAASNVVLVVMWARFAAGL
jgi:hypothetical protein